jgi:hypothetical protein
MIMTISFPIFFKNITIAVTNKIRFEILDILGLKY